MTTVYFAKPVTSDLRADVLQYIRDMANAQSRMFDGDTLVSPSIGVIRYSSSNTRFESWDGATFNNLNLSGSRFDTLAVGGAITIDQGGSNVVVQVGPSNGMVFKPRTTTGGWARGMRVLKESDLSPLAGAGWYGVNEAVTGFYVGIGSADWWSDYKLGITAAAARFNVNVGLSADPPAWDAAYKTLALGATSYINGNGAGVTVGNNGYFDGANWKYLTTAPVTDYYQYNGDHVWRSAPSGTAGTNATMLTRMRLMASGDLLLGPTGAALSRDPNYVGFDIGTLGNGFHGIKDSPLSGFALTSNVYIESGGWKCITTGSGAALNVNASGGSGVVFEFYRSNGSAGGAPSWTLLGQFTTTEFLSPLQVVCGPSGTGRVNLVPGGATNPGYVEFRTPDGTRRGYIGWQIGTVNLELRGENGRTFAVFGGRTWTTNGWTSGLEMGAGNALRWQLSGGYSWGIGNSGGNLYFGTSTVDDASAAISTYWLTVTGSSALCTFSGPITAGGNITGPILYGTSYIYSYGTVYAQGDVIAYYSDERLKKRRGNITSALDKVLALDGFKYQLNKKGRKLMNREDDRAMHVGVSAQQVKRVLPEAVALAPFDMDQETGRSKSGDDYLTVKYERLVPLLIEAIKELNDKVDRL